MYYDPSIDGSPNQEDNILDGVKSVTSGVEYLSLESPTKEPDMSASAQILKALILE